MNPYDYPDVKTCFKLQRNRKNKSWQQYDARFETAFKEGNSPDRTVKGEYFRPKNTDKAPGADD